MFSGIQVFEGKRPRRLLAIDRQYGPAIRVDEETPLADGARHIEGDIRAVAARVFKLYDAGQRQAPVQPPSASGGAAPAQRPAPAFAHACRITWCRQNLWFMSVFH